MAWPKSSPPHENGHAPLVTLKVTRKEGPLLPKDGADIHGALTDVDGIMKPLQQRNIVPGGHGLILGAGGAAQAAAIALDEKPACS